MKKKLILLAVGLPILLFFVLQNLVSWRPKFVVQDPSLSTELKWSRDGKVVRIASVQLNIPATPNTVPKKAPPVTYSYFDVRTRQRLSDVEPSWNFEELSNSKYKLKSNFSYSMTEKETIDYLLNFKEKALSLCNADGKKCRSLPDTPSPDFKIEVNNKGEEKPLFNSYRISDNNSQLLIIGGGEIRIWNTADGRLTKRIPLATIKENTTLKTVISPDIQNVIVQIGTQEDRTPAKVRVVDTNTGKSLFALAEEQIRDFDFTPNPKIIWSLSTSNATRVPTYKLSFNNSQNGQTLWECPLMTPIKPVFLPDRKSLILPNATGLEVRNFANGKIERIFVGQFDIKATSLSPDGTRLWTSHGDGSVWSWRTG